MIKFLSQMSQVPPHSRQILCQMLPCPLPLLLPLPHLFNQIPEAYSFNHQVGTPATLALSSIAFLLSQVLFQCQGTLC